MARCDSLVAQEMAVATHDFEYVDGYVACGCVLEDDNHLFNVSGRQGFR